METACFREDSYKFEEAMMEVFVSLTNLMRYGTLNFVSVKQYQTRIYVWL